MFRPRNRTIELRQKTKSNAATASPRVRGQLRRRAYAFKLRISQLLRCNIGSTRLACATKRAGMIATDIKQAENCETMEQVRRGVDEIDAALIVLLARRFGYMDAAARIKTDRSSVRDNDRKQAVIANVTAAAVAVGIPADVIADMWEALVEGSIAYEMDAWDSLRG